ncbi:receptor-like serine threonine- kinase ALE2 isoform X1 [Tanacetum coccineum]
MVISYSFICLSTLLSVTKSFWVGGSTIGNGPESASLSLWSNIAYKGSAKTFSSSDMEKATDNFNELGVLGEGGFGRVYSGTLEDGTKVAVNLNIMINKGVGNSWHKLKCSADFTIGIWFGYLAFVQKKKSGV